jgi:hypothetical protein
MGLENWTVHFFKLGSVDLVGKQPRAGSPMSFRQLIISIGIAIELDSTRILISRNTSNGVKFQRNFCFNFVTVENVILACTKDNAYDPITTNQ